MPACALSKHARASRARPTQASPASSHLMGHNTGIQTGGNPLPSKGRWLCAIIKPFTSASVITSPSFAVHSARYSRVTDCSFAPGTGTVTEQKPGHENRPFLFSFFFFFFAATKTFNKKSKRRKQG